MIPRGLAVGVEPTSELRQDMTHSLCQWIRCVHLLEG
jgi:hypothetical protein